MLHLAGATPYMTEMAKGRAVRPESKNMAQKQSGFPRNLGDPAVSTGISRPWERPNQTLPAHRCCVLGGGSETKPHRVGTAKRRQRSAAGWTAGSRSVLIVPTKHGNATTGPWGGKRGVILWNCWRETRQMPRNLSTVSTKQQRVATLAKQSPHMGFTSLAYLMDIDWLREAYRRIRKDAAAGVDEVTAADYEVNLEGNLQALLDRVKAGTYRAPPVRRVYIPKGNSATETRPIGIPTLEDKVLQRAVVMLLEPIYEQDFYDCSYGFRPGRSAHQALETLWEQTMDSHGGWLLEVDIRKFFDTLDQAHLRAFLRQRVRDGVLLRLIDKWLQASVMEDGAETTPEAGSPQGGVISPLLANIYLHYVLDDWFVKEVKPRLRGQAHLIRYADDFVIGFTQEEDAKRVQAVLPQRLGKYGLAIHPEKTRLLPFGRPPRARNGKGPGQGTSPGAFSFLGFTHHWGRSLRGNWVVMRKTAKDRFSRAVRSIAQWCRFHRHDPIAEQQLALSRKVRGHYAYYGITGNMRMLEWFRCAVVRRWQKWLNRRDCQRKLGWNQFARLLRCYPLPWPSVVHSVCARAASP